ncbi:hypothetical protein DyAD56_08270 [Dyella sp. AD56]|nr:hypothetical protein DyAD56_08270 [Dyella sp. AD56]ULU25897.1 hypothetical protein DYST_02835 [Dyella terrae]
MNTTHKSDSQHSDERKSGQPQRDDNKQHSEHSKPNEPKQPNRHEQDHGATHKK